MKSKNRKRYVTFWKFGFFINQRHNVTWFQADHIQHTLIIDERNVFPYYLFLIVFILLHLDEFKAKSEETE